MVAHWNYAGAPPHDRNTHHSIPQQKYATVQGSTRVDTALLVEEAEAPRALCVWPSPL